LSDKNYVVDFLMLLTCFFSDSWDAPMFDAVSSTNLVTSNPNTTELIAELNTVHSKRGNLIICMFVFGLAVAMSPSSRTLSKKCNWSVQILDGPAAAIYRLIYTYVETDGAIFLCYLSVPIMVGRWRSVSFRSFVIVATP